MPPEAGDPDDAGRGVRAPVALSRKPRVLRLEPAARWRSGLAAPLAAGVAWLGLVAVHEWLRPPDAESTLCVLRTVTGVPCPTCGGTRAVLAAARGHPIEAVAHNPLVVAGLGLAAAWVVLRVGFGRRLTVTTPSWPRGTPWIAAALLAGANWAWVVARHA